MSDPAGADWNIRLGEEVFTIEDIRRVQQFLNEWDHAKLEVDGILGPQTKAAAARIDGKKLAANSDKQGVELVQRVAELLSAPIVARAGGPSTLSRGDVRRAQMVLNSLVRAELEVDGIAGPRTRAAAEQYLREWGSDLEHDPNGALMRKVAALPVSPPARPTSNDDPDVLGIWTFYRTESDDPFWPGTIAVDDTIFCRHGSTRRAGTYSSKLRAGDTVVLLVEQEVVGTGMLLAGDEACFVDADGQIRRPVRILQTHRDPISRPRIERLAKRKLIQHSGTVHRVSRSVVYELNDTHTVGSTFRSYHRSKNKRLRATLPYDREWLDETLTFRPLLADLEAFAPSILPDAETAARLGWKGETRGSAARGRGRRIDVEIVEGVKVSDEADAGSDPDNLDPDVRIRFVLDDPKDSEDELDRGPFALFLAQRLHLIWCQMNGHAPDPDKRGKPTTPRPADSDTFIAHVDSPWGGGKTSFANFVARVLDPRGQELTPGHFLRSSLAPTTPDKALRDVSLDEVFVPDYARKAGAAAWPGARRPWVIARYNAWRDQFVQPPWWQVFLAIESAVAGEFRNAAGSAVRSAWLDGRPLEYLRAIGPASRWMRVRIARLSYQIWNRKLKAQVILLGVVTALLGLAWLLGAFNGLLGAGSAQGAGLDPKKASDWLALGTALLGFGGASLAAVVTAIGQSISPDLDFTAEHKQIGVQDPIRRFRKTFDRIVRATDRPVLLIVDDLDRCEPATVVELMRGFQTIIRSPRLFVLLLGDRAWIEKAHDVHHKDLGTLREGEDGIGARFVQKVIQLSFRLPTMKPEARTRYAQGVLGERIDPATEDPVAQFLERVDAETSVEAAGTLSVGGREALKADAIERAKAALPKDLSEEAVTAAVARGEALVDVKLVAASGADSAQQRAVFNAIARLVDSLPNNPRQIKRIFMAFATYENVGRAYFGYQLTPSGGDGERKARRWRQLAMWVTLAIEWPETWRAIAARPALLDTAYAEPKQRAKADAALLKPLDAEAQVRVTALLARLRSDKALVALLGKRDAGAGDSDDFANTPMEAEAIYEFNRIIWEPGFALDAAAG